MKNPFAALSDVLVEKLQKLACAYEAATGSSSLLVAAVLFDAATALCIFAAVANITDVILTIVALAHEPPIPKIEIGLSSFILFFAAVSLVGSYYNKRSNDRAAADCRTRAAQPPKIGGTRNLERLLRRQIHLGLFILVMPACLVDIFLNADLISEMANICLAVWMVMNTLAAHLHDCDSDPSARRREALRAKLMSKGARSM